MQPTTDLPVIQVSYQPLHISKRRKICSSRCVYDVLMEVWNRDTIQLLEEFLVLFLDRKNGIIGYRVIGRGSNCATVVDSRLMFSIALSLSACSIIVSHNHPSGTMKPSGEDLKLTKKIKNAGDFLEIKLLDHLIVSDQSYYSFMDEGLI